jgi:hypothetical protein
MNYHSFIEHVRREIQAMTKCSRLCGTIRDKHSHTASDFQLFLIPANASVRIQMMLILLCDSFMNKVLPMVRWGDNAQEMLLSDILDRFNYP